MPKILTWIIIILIVLGVGLAGYKYMGKKASSTSDTTSANASAEDTSAVEADLSDFNTTSSDLTVDDFATGVGLE